MEIFTAKQAEYTVAFHHFMMEEFGHGPYLFILDRRRFAQSGCRVFDVRSPLRQLRANRLKRKWCPLLSNGTGGVDFIGRQYYPAG